MFQRLRRRLATRIVEMNARIAELSGKGS